MVVANVNMATTTAQHSNPSQIDRMQPLMHGKAQKLAFKMTASPPLPCSMFTGTVDVPGDTLKCQGMLGSVHAESEL